MSNYLFELEVGVCPPELKEQRLFPLEGKYVTHIDKDEAVK